MRWLVLFAKPPLPGRAKTRLADEIGPAAAARIAEALLQETLALCEGLLTASSEAAPRLVLAYTDAIEWFTPRLAADWRLVEQRGADPGERLGGVLEQIQPEADDATVFIGTDCPQMPPERIAEAFEALAEVDAVLGPCDDGGCYLLGVRGRLAAGALDDVGWSTDSALADTEAALAAAGLTVAHLAPEFNVDTVGDLGRLAHGMASGTVRALEALTRVLADLDLA
ncbi:MAG: TIGR04282 family arsenosugar biosynthesis glycosyltransferase [Armatimonadota bacterium]